MARKPVAYSPATDMAASTTTDAPCDAEYLTTARRCRATSLCVRFTRPQCTHRSGGCDHRDDDAHSACSAVGMTSRREERLRAMDPITIASRRDQLAPSPASLLAWATRVAPSASGSRSRCRRAGDPRGSSRRSPRLYERYRVPLSQPSTQTIEASSRAVALHDADRDVRRRDLRRRLPLAIQRGRLRVGDRVSSHCETAARALLPLIRLESRHARASVRL